MNDQKLNNALPFGELLARIAKDATLFTIIGAGLYLLLSVIGYHSHDPGWSHLGYRPDVDNFTGVAGAWLADFTISFVGVSAYIIPLMLLFTTIRFMLRRQIGLLDGIPYLILRAVGATLVILPLSALAAIHLSNQSLQYPFTAGGILGQAISDWTVSWFSIVGSSLLLWTVMLVGLTLYMEMSWKDLLTTIGKAILSLGSRAKNEARDLAGSENDQNEYSERTDTVAYAKEPVNADPDHSAGHKVADLISRFNQHEVTPERKEPVFEPEVAPQPEGRREETIDLSFGATTVSQGESGGNAVVKDRSEAPAAKAVIPELVDSVSEEELEAGTVFKDTIKAPVPAPAQETDTVMQPVAEEPQEVARIQAEQESHSHQHSNEDGKKGVKIVPLSETHKPLKDNELDVGSKEAPVVAKPVRIPSLDLLDPPELKQETGYSEEQLESMSRLLEAKLKDFGVVAEVVEVNPGPVITRFEIQPAPGVKASKITNLAKDLARSMAVMSVRVVEVIAGKSVVGIEIPNEVRQTVRLSEVLNSKPYLEASSRLTLALGNDIAGNPTVANLAKMPHLLVAGTTGSGKSVGVNAMLLSLLLKARPDEVRLMLVDPKMLELSIYEGIPHLLTPVITDMKEAAGGLRWCVAEMERRYRLMAKMGVRNLAGFNEKIVNAQKQGEPLRDPLWNPAEYGYPPEEPAPELEALPYIVVVIDEFADMMMMVGKKVEELIARIAQKARAAGIHLILATQRPSVDVITGLIKANVPTRIAFQVSSKIDSRTILDQSGGEHLLGWGDMLYLPAGTSMPNRVHGAFVSDDEVHRVVEAWKQIGQPDYIVDIVSEGEGETGGGSGGLFDDEQDALYDEAVAFVTETRKASISSVQRKLKIGYNRAARMIEAMEAAGVVSEAGSNGQREVLAPPPPPRN